MNIVVKRCLVLIMAMSLMTAPVTPVLAAMVSTQEIVQADIEENQRSILLERLQQESVISQLKQHGIDPDLATERVRYMTAEEVAMLNQQFDQLPAGQGIGGLIVLLFLVFVITDAIGATDVFTFVRPVR